LELNKQPTMKKIALLIFISGMFSVTLFSQEGKLEFIQKKATDNGYTVYFHVVDIEDSDHIDSILEELLNDNNIYKGRHFISGTGKDRFQLYINEIVSAEYVRNILLSQNVDYEYTCVSVDGNVESSPNSYSGSVKRHINSNGFPRYIKTGNQETDDKKYKNSKDQWINENPEEYNKLLEELNEKENSDIE